MCARCLLSIYAAVSSLIEDIPALRVLWPTVMASVLCQATRTHATTRNVSMVAVTSLLPLLLFITIVVRLETIAFAVGLRRWGCERFVADLPIHAPNHDEQCRRHDKYQVRMASHSSADRRARSLGAIRKAL